MKPRTYVLPVLVLALALPRTGATEGKSGLSPSKLKLPKGPGSIEGIGENAKPNINMGTLDYGVPMDLPGGRGELRC